MNEFSNLILNLKQDTGQISVNPVLDVIDLDDCKVLEASYDNDTFIKEKIDNAMNLLSDLGIDYNPRYNQVYQEYSEGIVYLMLKNKGLSISRIPEGSAKTPDFNICLSCGKSNVIDINFELKSLSFFDGNLNYHEAQKAALEAKIKLEERSRTSRIAFTEYPISPMNKKGNQPTYREVIENLIEKINQNIKPDQFNGKDTILMIDLKQLCMPYTWQNNTIAIYDEPMYHSKCSGILWNVAFGHIDEMIYKPIEFEGKSNIDGHLKRNGILVDNPFVKALVFICYENFKNRKLVSLFRFNEIDSGCVYLLRIISDFCNDDNNSHAFEILERTEHP